MNIAFIRFYLEKYLHDIAVKFSSGPCVVSIIIYYVRIIILLRAHAPT